jgi:hypothetical protein
MSGKLEIAIKHANGRVCPADIIEAGWAQPPRSHSSTTTPKHCMLSSQAFDEPTIPRFANLILSLS